MIGILAGAVREHDEWLCVLLGEASQDGYTVTVDGIYTPAGQTRTSATCELDERAHPLPPDVHRRKIGSLHSHHVMSPNPSGTDLGQGGLFYTYTLSIVISSQMKSLEDKIFGWSYYGEKRVRLGCGAYAKLPVVIVPIGYENDWPIACSEVIKAPDTLEAQVETLGDCRRWTEMEGTNRYLLRRAGKCGMTEEKERVRQFLFGADGSPVLDELPLAKKAELTPRDFHQGGYGYYGRTREEDYYDSVDFDSEIHSRDTDEIPVIRLNNHSSLVKVAK